MLKSFRTQLDEINRLKAKGTTRDKDEAGELMTRLSQQLRSYLQKQTGVEQPKLGKQGNLHVTRPDQTMSNGHAPLPKRRH